MEIKSVKLNHIPAVTEPLDENGLGQQTHGDLYSFEVTTSDKQVLSVPNDTANAHYWLVKEWYDAHEVKPFEFEFEELPEPKFAETVYPATAEELEEFFSSDIAEDESEPAEEATESTETEG
jgi:hypothetical protein